jgi:hypothetical protein
LNVAGKLLSGEILTDAGKGIVIIAIKTCGPTLKIA